MKSTRNLFLVLFLMVFLFVGCSTKSVEDKGVEGENQANVKTEAKTVENTENSQDNAKNDEKTEADAKSDDAKSDSEKSENVSDKKYKVAISQFALHPSLDNCRTGFIEGLAEFGIEEGKNLEILYQNSEADTGIMNQISSNFVEENPDLICAIATPSAQSAYNIASEAGIDVVYIAVTDPVSAGLADSDMKPVGGVTGVSDVQPVDAQLKMIREIMPNAKKIGILYTTSEANSIATIEKYKDNAAKYGFEIVAVGISNVAEIDLALDNILSKVDALTNIIDNTVVSALPIVIEKANEKKIPVFGSEEEQVKSGCLASEGADYIEYGRVGGRMAYKILSGESSAKDMKYEALEQAMLSVNTEVAKNLGIELSDELLNRAKNKY